MMKVADTPKGQQVGGYSLIHYDLEFSARAFSFAAEIAENIEGKELPPILGGLGTVAEILKTADPVLRKGALMSISDSNRELPESVLSSSLFEAGVARYARCFNTGKRTRLSKSAFSGPTAKYRSLHGEIMDIRNAYIAHAGMEHEDCLVGFQHINDLNYGIRPSTQFALLTMRPPHPSATKLRELSAHCMAIDQKIVRLKMEKAIKALREELLKLNEAEIAELTDFDDYKHKVQKVLADEDGD